MLCPGISQQTKHHQLSLYKSQVWKEKSFLELCNHNVLFIAYELEYLFFDTESYVLTHEGELLFPPVPGQGFISDRYPMIPYDPEILQSFALLTNITSITCYKFIDGLSGDVKYQLVVGSFKCRNPAYSHKCVPFISYLPWYIWTKEGLQM